jgi:hypothetical protein
VDHDEHPGHLGWLQSGDTNSMPFRMNKVSPPGTPAGADWYTNVMFVAASGGDVTNGGTSSNWQPMAPLRTIGVALQ